MSTKHPTTTALTASELSSRPASRGKPSINNRFDLVNGNEVCRILGGTDAPIDKSTLYRGMRDGRYPRPICVSPKVRRWVRSELEQVVRNLSNRRRATR